MMQVNKLAHQFEARVYNMLADVQWQHWIDAIVYLGLISICKVNFFLTLKKE